MNDDTLLDLGPSLVPVTVAYHSFTNIPTDSWVASCSNCRTITCHDSVKLPLIQPHTDRAFCYKCESFSLKILTNNTYQHIVNTNDVTTQTWYHATSHDNLPEIIQAITTKQPIPDNRTEHDKDTDEYTTTPNRVIHLGTLQMVQEFQNIKLSAKHIYQITLKNNTPTHPHVVMDDGVLDRAWETTTSENQIYRYKNYFENIGSICLVVQPHHISNITRITT